MAGEGQTSPTAVARPTESSSTSGAEPRIVRNQGLRTTGSAGSREGQAAGEGEAHPRYYEHHRQFGHYRHHNLRPSPGEIDQGYGAEHQRHKEQVARGEDAELGPTRWNEKTQEDDKRRKAYAAEQESLLLGRTHSTSRIPWA